MPAVFGAARVLRTLTLFVAVFGPLLLVAASCTWPGRPPRTTTTTTRSTGSTTTVPPGTEKRPVLLVSGTLQALSIVNVARSALQQRGYRAYSMTLEGSLIGVNASSTESGRAICQKIDSIRRETGADKIDVAGHSQGSIASRWCIKSGGALDKVHTFVSVGGVDNGTTTALACNFLGQGCVDMMHGSAFLAALNAGDDTPGDARVFKIYSTPAGGGVEGEDAPIQDGAVNRSAQELCNGVRLTHADEYRSVIVHSFLDNVFAGREPVATCR
jgi:pimeloyl-ACP methyl ester carboxylesterase